MYVYDNILDVDVNMRKKLTGDQLNFYISDTIELIEKYKAILKKPTKISFFGPLDTSKQTEEEKSEIVKQYTKIIRNYHHMSVDSNASANYVTNPKCQNCGELIQEIDSDGITIVCSNCSCEQTIVVSSVSYYDTERINLTNKFAYDRKTHFRECISQYHGKQNVVIPQKVYDDLEKAFVFNGLINEHETNQQVKYQNITKKNILIFLKDLGYSKQYENVNLIYNKITGVKLDDISYLYESILTDFDLLSDLYDKKFSNQSRKNFINTQYVLFQLLSKNKHKCKKEDFSNLKAIDRKFFHENILKSLFEDLGWNYTSIF
jgi:hypothetical protein